MKTSKHCLGAGPGGQCILPLPRAAPGPAALPAECWAPTQPNNGRFDQRAGNATAEVMNSNEERGEC